jgi:hypothetical protein
MTMGLIAMGVLSILMMFGAWAVAIADDWRETQIGLVLIAVPAAVFMTVAWIGANYPT